MIPKLLTKHISADLEFGFTTPRLTSVKASANKNITHSIGAGMTLLSDWLDIHTNKHLCVLDPFFQKKGKTLSRGYRGNFCIIISVPGHWTKASEISLKTSFKTSPFKPPIVPPSRSSALRFEHPASNYH
jgi:hypothetical protein